MGVQTAKKVHTLQVKHSELLTYLQQNVQRL